LTSADTFAERTLSATTSVIAQINITPHHPFVQMAMPLDQPRHQHLIGVAIIDLHLILAPRAYLGLITHSQDTPPLHGHVSGLGLGGIHGNNFLSRKNCNWFVLSARHELGLLS